MTLFLLVFLTSIAAAQISGVDELRDQAAELAHSPAGVVSELRDVNVTIVGNTTTVTFKDGRMDFLSIGTVKITGNHS